MTCRRRHDARGCFTGEEEVGTDELLSTCQHRLLSTCQHRLPRQPTVFTRSPVRGEGQRVRISPGCENMKRPPPLYPHLYHGRVLSVCLSLHQLSLTSFPLLLRFLSVDPTPRCSCMQLCGALLASGVRKIQCFYQTAIMMLRLYPGHIEQWSVHIYSDHGTIPTGVHGTIQVERKLGHDGCSISDCFSYRCVVKKHTWVTRM